MRSRYLNPVYSEPEPLPEQINGQGTPYNAYIAPDESYIIVDRLSHAPDEDYYSRVGDSIQTAFYEGFGDCIIYRLEDDSKTAFTNRFELDGVEYIEPSINFFSFNKGVICAVQDKDFCLDCSWLCRG